MAPSICTRARTHVERGSLGRREMAVEVFEHEFSVGEPEKFDRHLDRALVQRRAFSADPEMPLLARLGILKARNRFGIGNHHGRIADAIPQHPSQHRRAIPGSSSADIIRGLYDDAGPDRISACGGKRLIEVPFLRQTVGAPRPWRDRQARQGLRRPRRRSRSSRGRMRHFSGHRKTKTPLPH